MVGIPTSTGCLICRKRKIKCDETWSSGAGCLNCQKNGKTCPGPPARHTFKDLGPRLNPNFAAAPILAIPTDNITDQGGALLTQVNEKRSESGAMFRKFRMSDRDGRHKRYSRSPRPKPSQSPPQVHFLRQPSPSQHERLTQALVHAMNSGDAGHRMCHFGPFMQEVPARIGSNGALDAAVACLVNTHHSVLHSKHTNEPMNATLYLRAIQALQHCLNSEDSSVGMSSSTLCASVLLGLAEALAGPRSDNKYLAHVGGAGRLIELQGPQQYNESFAKDLLRFNRGGIIISSMYQRRPCFLTTASWRNIAFDKSGLTPREGVHNDILYCLAGFPDLLHEFNILHKVEASGPDEFSESTSSRIQDIYGPWLDLEHLPSSNENSPLDMVYYQDSPCFATERTSLIDKLYSLKGSLYALGTHLNGAIGDGSAAVEVSSSDSTSPISTSYRFSDWRVTVAYSCFWSLLILANKLLMQLLPMYDAAQHALIVECQSVALEICKTWEDSWERRPIGAFHVGLSFVSAYEFCTLEVQSWILKGLNALLDEQLVDTFRWDDDTVRSMSEKLCGKGPDISFDLKK